MKEDMEKKTVQIKAYYTSTFGMMQTQEWTVSSTDEAKRFVETKMDEISRPKYELTATVTNEGGMEYDVTRMVAYNFSHFDITDYTDGREMTCTDEIEGTNN